MNGTGSNLIRSEGTGADSGNRAKDLSREERKGDVDSGECLQENHAETDTLHSVQYTEPEP